ncbi:hypothetical protein QJS10_CPA07g00756 [Acorus calamus]|uniref:Uncharacterized protein n=1 Tax=Acorus calamus TaxID=4465 RepID=A0AAV9EJ72_ACOCL|nr:hypothetical protein QJS10_CPA07g00756 [Acorus calamus]
MSHSSQGPQCAHHLKLIRRWEDLQHPPSRASLFIALHRVIRRVTLHGQRAMQDELCNIAWPTGIEEDWLLWRAKMAYNKKAIFCCDIGIVAVIHFLDFRIAIARAGDDRGRWTELEISSQASFIDLTYHGGRLYVFEDGDDHVAVLDDLSSHVRGVGAGYSPNPRILGTLLKAWSAVTRV